MSNDNSANRPRKLWTQEEDDILRAEVEQRAKQGAVTDWRSIAAKLPNRTNKDCRKRWIRLDGSINKGSWGEDEDERLRQAVQQHTNAPAILHHTVIISGDKTYVAKACTECAKRWMHFLDPNLDHSAWTKHDDERLLAEVSRHGHNWRKIVDEVLEGRSATDAKNRYTILQRSKSSINADRLRPLRRRRLDSHNPSADSHYPEGVSANNYPAVSEEIVGHGEDSIGFSAFDDGMGVPSNVLDGMFMQTQMPGFANGLEMTETALQHTSEMIWSPMVLGGSNPNQSSTMSTEFAHTPSPMSVYGYPSQMLPNQVNDGTHAYFSSDPSHEQYLPSNRRG